MKTLRYVVVRGREKGVALTPHNGDDGKHVASLTRFKKDYVKVGRVEDLIPLMQKGYGVRIPKTTTGIKKTNRLTNIISVVVL